MKEMLKQRREKQQMELVILEQMVPEDHFLRKVDRAVGFSFIYDLCAPLYCTDNGQPATNGFYYSEHRTVDSKRNEIVNMHVEAANINDATTMRTMACAMRACLKYGTCGGSVS